jgi:hypothetical protein
MDRREFLRGITGAAGVVALGKVGELDGQEHFFEVSFLIDRMEEIIEKPILRDIYTARSALALRALCRAEDKKVCSLEVTIVEYHIEYRGTLVCVLASLEEKNLQKYVVYYDPIKAGYYYRKRTWLDFYTKDELLIMYEVRDRLIKEGCWEGGSISLQL